MAFQFWKVMQQISILWWCFARLPKLTRSPKRRASYKIPHIHGLAADAELEDHLGVLLLELSPPACV